MAIDDSLIRSLMRAVRTKSDQGEEEIDDLVHECIADLEIKGVYVTDYADTLFRAAAKLYCKAHYGYDADNEKYQAAYDSLADAMALSGDYRRVVLTDE